MNPYAPPRAAVADIEEDDEGGVQPVKTWSSEGRVGRLRYLAHSVAAYLVMAVVGGIASGVASALRAPALGTVVLVVAGIAYGLFIILKSIQRAHDMDWTGWSVLLTLIPLVGFVWLFKGGTKGSNRFGAPPPPNGFGVKFLGLILPIISFAIIFAVAIPAYKSYTKRAQLQQQLQMQQR